MNLHHSLSRERRFAFAPTFLLAPLPWEHLSLFTRDLLPYLALGVMLAGGALLIYTGRVRMHRSMVGRIIATLGSALTLSAGGLGATLLPTLSPETALLAHDAFLLAAATTALRALFLLKKMGLYNN